MRIHSTERFFEARCALFYVSHLSVNYCIFFQFSFLYFFSIQVLKDKQNVPSDIHSRNHQKVYVLLSWHKDMYLAVTQIKLPKISKLHTLIEFIVSSWDMQQKCTTYNILHEINYTIDSESIDPDPLFGHVSKNRVNKVLKSHSKQQMHTRMQNGICWCSAVAQARKQVVQFATHYRAHLWADLWLKRKRSLIFWSFPRWLVALQEGFDFWFSVLWSLVGCLKITLKYLVSIFMPEITFIFESAILVFSNPFSIYSLWLISKLRKAPFDCFWCVEVQHT